MPLLRDLATAPPIAPPRFSLLANADTVEDSSLRWQGGYTYLSEVLPEGSRGVSGIDLADCYAWDPDPEVERGTRTVTADPVVVWVGDVCSTLQSAWRRDAEARVRRQLLAHQSALLATELWATVLGPGAAVATLAAAAPAAALACLEEALHDALGGPVGVVHVGPGALTHLVAAQAVRLDGTRWVTPMGSVVLADAGYAHGAGPTGTADGWMVGTGTVRVKLGQIEVQPVERGDAGWAEVADVRRNTVRVLAWRPVLVEVDLAAHVAALVTMTCA